MYGTPFGAFFNALNEIDRELSSDSMPALSCRTDIIESGDKYILEVEMPGFEKSDISLDINGELLTISAERKAPASSAETKYIRRERRYGKFKRSFDISDVDSESISAEYKNGILIIELPKKKPVDPVSKSVTIN